MTWNQSPFGSWEIKVPIGRVAVWESRHFGRFLVKLEFAQPVINTSYGSLADAMLAAERETRRLLTASLAALGEPK